MGVSGTCLKKPRGESDLKNPTSDILLCFKACDDVSVVVKARPLRACTYVEAETV